MLAALRRRVRHDEGVTLVELVMAIGLSTMIGLATSSLIWVTSATLGQQTDDALLTAQLVRFSRVLASDVSSSTDIFVFGSDAPASTSHMCSSFTNGGLEWTATKNESLRRHLFTIQTFIADGSSRSSDFSFLTQWIGYDLGYVASSTSPHYVIYRVTCTNPDASNTVATGADDAPQPMLNLGPNDTSLIAGSEFLYCQQKQGDVELQDKGLCPVDASTADYVVYGVDVAKAHSGDKVVDDPKEQRRRALIADLATRPLANLARQVVVPLNAKGA